MQTGKITKSEWLLLGITAVFLCGLLLLKPQTPQERPSGVTVETENTVSQEEFLPDLSPLNLNTATAEELTELPGIGEALAWRIVQYREEQGPFRNIGELMNVSGIGQGKFDALKEQITVEGTE